MPSNAEAKPDTLTAEAENCLLIKNSNSRNSPRENNRKNAENLLPLKKEEPKRDVKKEKPKEEKREEEKKRDKPKPEGRKERTREKKSNGGTNGSKPMSMQQLITQNLPASRERLVRQSDIERTGLHSSVAPVNPALDIEIDPELDMMLAELELDEEFSSLGENEQKSWLESLFFMDTKHNPGRQPRDQLSKTKVQKKNTLRVNQDSATRLNNVEPKNREPVLEDPEVAATAVHVNDKMKNLAQDFFKPKSNTPAASKSSVSVERKTSIRTATPPEMRKTSIRTATPPEMPSPDLSRKDSLTTFTTPPTSRKSSNAGERNSIAESMGEISGAKQNLQSLAQSYFQSPQPKPVARKNSNVEESWEEEKARRDAEEKEREEQLSKEEKEKASLVASFFGGTASKPATSKPVAKPANRSPVKVVERASFTPNAGTELQDEEDEDDEIDRLIKAAEKERAALLEKPVPAPPPRNGDNRALAMMKRLGNINNIMQGKKPARDDEDNDD